MNAALTEHLDRLAGRLRELLGEQLVAVWAGGSLALDDVRPTSDLDAAIVVDRPLTAEERRGAVDALLAAAAAVPARGLEAVVYAREDLAGPERGAHQVNVDGGPGMTTHVGAPGDDPAFWFIIDLAILRSVGRAITGPDPRELIAEVPEDAIRGALRRSLTWHREHGERLDQVLNACRAWHHLATGRWVSKTRAAAWVIERTDGDLRAAVEAAAARRADPDLPGPSARGARRVSAHVMALLDGVDPPTSDYAGPVDLA